MNRRIYFLEKCIKCLYIELENIISIDLKYKDKYNYIIIFYYISSKFKQRY